jgi:hypothetical protein
MRILQTILNFYRTDKLFPISWYFPGYKIEREWDYTCYLLFKVLLTASIFYSLFLIIDAYFQLDILIPVIPFYFDKIVFYDVFAQYMRPVSFALTAVFYFKLRLSIQDIKTEKIPYIENRDHFKNENKKQFLKGTLILIAMSIFAIIMPHLFSTYVTQHFGFSTSFTLAISVHVFSILILALFTSYLVHLLLMLEKTLRNFENIEFWIQRMDVESFGDW